MGYRLQRPARKGTSAMKVCVVGTGYVGLTTGVSLAFLGHDVTCVDLDEAKVEMLRGGRSPIYEPHLDALLAEAAEPDLHHRLRRGRAGRRRGVHRGADAVAAGRQPGPAVPARRRRTASAAPRRRLHRRGQQVDGADRQRQLGRLDPARVVRATPRAPRRRRVRGGVQSRSSCARARRSTTRSTRTGSSSAPTTRAASTCSTGSTGRS